MVRELVLFDNFDVDLAFLIMAIATYEIGFVGDRGDTRSMHCWRANSCNWRGVISGMNEVVGHGTTGAMAGAIVAVPATMSERPSIKSVGFHSKI